MKALLSAIEKMRSVQTLVFGDAIIDRYYFGRVERICPEGPVPVFIPMKTENRFGGAAHVKEQIDALCQPAHQLFGVPSSLKTRYMVGSHLLLRCDEDAIAQKVNPGRLEKEFDDIIGGVQAVVISDYNKGFCTKSACEALISRARAKGVPVIVDPKGTNWSKYEGCTVICPNMAELKAWSDANEVFPNMLLKCGSEGLSLFMPSGQIDFKATARHVYDVTGAGDTVVAVFAAALGAGAPMTHAAMLANLAAGYCVGEVGTAICDRGTLIEMAAQVIDGERLN